MGHAILIGCDDPVGQALLSALSARSGLEVQAFPTVEAAMPGLQATSPTVVLVGPGETAAQGIALASHLAREDRDTAVLMLVNALDTALLRAAIKAGVRDVLAVSDGLDAAFASVVVAEEAASKHRAAATIEQPAPSQALEAARVITVFSTKGGVGKSVLATNLGVALARDLGKRAIIVDLDLEFGDVSVMLQLKPERTIFDAAQAYDRLDDDMLRGFLVEHESGLLALLAPVRPEDAEIVTIGRITQIISLLRTMADYIVIDTGASLSEVVLTALEQSDVVLAVATLDVPSVKNTKVSLQKLHQLGFDGSRIQFVLNRADSKVWLEPHEIEKAISDRIVARIPSDRLVPRSVNKGVPVVMDAPRSAVTRSILALAREVMTS